ncbi:MAG: FAD-dependent oxidoreductase [Acidobacteriia bacterium]|nr:FAD-dependent oxidoreductase [Terriglobia bacterium]
MPERFDLVVVGTGAAASTVAFACRKAGWSVAVAEARPFGGTCANRGCDPKKVLVGAAEALDFARRMGPHGVAAEGLRIDWPALMRFKRSFTDPVPENTERSFAAAGIAAFHGTARFLDPQTIAAGGATLRAEHWVIAAGAAPARLGIPGEELLITSDQFLEMAPVAGYEGRIVAANLLAGNHQKPNYLGCASTVFSIPPLASAGLTEEAARRQGLQFDVRQDDTTGWYASRRIAEECSGYKVLVERPGGRILGAHILGDGAEELINVFALAIRGGHTAQQVKEPLYAYPTHGSNIQYMV